MTAPNQLDVLLACHQVIERLPPAGVETHRLVGFALFGRGVQHDRGSPASPTSRDRTCAADGSARPNDSGMAGLFDGTSLQRPVTCERCGKPHGQCTCPRDRKAGTVLDPKDQALRIRREQRRGKFTTVIAGFSPRSDRSDDLPGLLKQLKSKFATGGTIDTADAGAPTLELQGDHRDKLVEYFKQLGYPAKAAGG